MIVQWLFDFSSALVAPPTSSQVRLDAAAPYTGVGHCWVRNLTTDGIDVHTGLLAMPVGSTIYLQDKNDHTLYVRLQTVAAGIDQTTYVDLPVAWVDSGGALINNQAIAFIQSPPVVGPSPTPPTLPTAASAGVRRATVWVVTVPPTAAQEPLTLAQAKLRAGLDWVDGDPRDDLMRAFLAAARAYVEQRIDHALATQTIDAYYDGVTAGAVLVLPSRALPIQGPVTVTSTDAAGMDHVLDPATYVVDPVRGLVALGSPLPTDVRPFQGWRVTVTAGLPVALMPPGLVQCVGLLTAHEATFGRDMASLASQGGITPVPFGFDLLIAPFEPLVLA